MRKLMLGTVLFVLLSSSVFAQFSFIGYGRGIFVPLWVEKDEDGEVEKKIGMTDSSGTGPRMEWRVKLLTMWGL